MISAYEAAEKAVLFRFQEPTQKLKKQHDILSTSLEIIEKEIKEAADKGKFSVSFSMTHFDEENFLQESFIDLLKDELKKYSYEVTVEKVDTELRLYINWDVY